jgi:hypothetical protein
MKGTINKKYILKYIINFICSALENKEEVLVNDLFIALLNEEEIAGYLEKRKNKFIYINLLLLNDKLLKQELSNNNIYYIKDKFVKIIKNNFTESKKDRVFIDTECYEKKLPYDLLISTYGRKRRGICSKTNEYILNNELHTNDKMNHLINILNDSLSYLSIEVDSSNIKIYFKNKLSFYIDFVNFKYIILNDYFKSIIKMLDDIYPYKYFYYNTILVISYLLLMIGSSKESKYINVLLFDNIVKNVIKKYFGDNDWLRSSKMFNTFFSDTIINSKYTDYELINNFFIIVKDDKDFIRFSVGLYKLIIYLKNKYNRDIKHIAIELYRSNIDIVNVSDFTSYESLNNIKV